MRNRKWIMAVCVILICTFAVAFQMEEIGQETMVAAINQEISSHDVSIILENVFLNPSASNLLGPGEIDEGNRVKERYGKGPFVVFDIKKEPEWIDKLGFIGGFEWYRVNLFSDGKSLSQKTIGNRISEFRFMTTTSPRKELKELGKVECKIELATIIKVCDISAKDIERGSQPIFQDEDVQIWDVKWEEKTPSSSGNPETSVRIGIDRKTEIWAFNVVLKGEKSNVQLSRKSFTLTEKSVLFRYRKDRKKIPGAELWKIIPVIEKTFPVEFVPQKDIVRD